MAAVTLIVPCYNEAERLDAEAFRAAVDQAPSLRLVLVDDGSMDDTQRVLEGLAADRPDRIEALALETNRGKAEAVRRGVLHALASSPDVVGYWDADLATPFEAVPDVLAPLEERPEALVAMGARVQLLGRDIRRSPARHYLGRVFATFASLTLAAPVYDTQCGAKLFRCTDATTRIFEEPFLARWIFDVELLARLARVLEETGGPPLEQVVVEVPLRRWVDIGGSRVRGKDFVAAARDLWRIRRRYGGRPRA